MRAGGMGNVTPLSGWMGRGAPVSSRIRVIVVRVQAVGFDGSRPPTVFSRIANFARPRLTRWKWGFFYWSSTALSVGATNLGRDRAMLSGAAWSRSRVRGSELLVLKWFFEIVDGIPLAGNMFFVVVRSVGTAGEFFLTPRFR